MGFGKLTPGFLFEEAGWGGLGRMGRAGEDGGGVVWTCHNVRCRLYCIKHCLVLFEQFAGDHRMFTSYVKKNRHLYMICQ